MPFDKKHYDKFVPSENMAAGAWPVSFMYLYEKLEPYSPLKHIVRIANHLAEMVISSKENRYLGVYWLRVIR